MTRRLPITAVLCVLAACVPTDTTGSKANVETDPHEAADKSEKSEKPETPQTPEKHLDVGADKSGVLARTAAVLETDEGIDNEDLRELSHHAEKAESVESLCKHTATLVPETDAKACVKDMEHHVVRLGPELYAQLSVCIMESTTVDELHACHAAEKEAEEALHAKPHGDGLDDETCTKFFDHYEEMAMADAGEENAEHVKEILEEVRDDVELACKEQGTKKEIECAMKSKNLHEVKECASLL